VSVDEAGDGRAEGADLGEERLYEREEGWD
jgi:hypothetical protein